MAYGKNETASKAYQRLLDWLDDCANTGGNVSNLALDLMNRAQEELRIYRPWSDLVRTTDLTLTDNAATLDDVVGEVFAAYADTDDDGLPDKWFWNSSKRVDDGYVIRDAFAKDTGHSRTITFYRAPSNTVTLEYITKLEDFVVADVDEDDDSYAAAYSFFPNSLLVARAQRIHALEGGVPDPNEYNGLMDREKDLLTDYSQSHEYINIDMRMELLDDDAVGVDLETYSMDLGSDGIAAPYTNDYDQG